MQTQEFEDIISLKSRLIQGPERVNLTFEEIATKWKYCGGDFENHLSYFKLRFPKRELPDHRDHCVCGHYIERNCYITNGDEILVLGNCCIKRFMKHSSRSCEVCDKPHKNRVVNFCNNCKEGHCHKCKRKHNSRFKICYACNNPEMVGKCYDCKKACNPNYKKCFTCFTKSA